MESGELREDLELNEDTYAYAGFWIRFVARLVDIVILCILSCALGITLAALGLEYLEEPYMSLLVTLLVISYFAGMESSSTQATLGKSLFHIKVIGSDGERISFLRAAFRFIFKELGTTILIGGIMIGLTEKKRGLHDMIADTFVISESKMQPLMELNKD